MSKRCLIGLTLGAALAGCSPRQAVSEHTSRDHKEPEVNAATYKAGYGVRLGDVAATFVGLRLSGVETHDLPGAAGGVAIPRDALLRTVRGDFVYVENGGWMLRSPVKAGVAAGGWIEIQDGLYEGDRIAVAGVEALWLAEISAVNGGVGCADGH